MNSEDGEDTWLTGWEQQCAESIESQPDYDQSLIQECDNSHKRTWNSFQDSATAIAQLYRDRYSGDPGVIWLQFQTAAGTVTALYKEACESLKKTTELAKQSGYQKRNSELLHWAKRKRRLIRREDLLTYLAGKPPPPRQSHHLHLTSHHHHHRLSPRLSPPPTTPHLHHHHHHVDPELRTFREALALGGVPHRATNQSRNPAPPADLCAFIANEMDRHLKRPASPTDVAMGSPTGCKRQRFM